MRNEASPVSGHSVLRIAGRITRIYRTCILRSSISSLISGSASGIISGRRISRLYAVRTGCLGKTGSRIIVRNVLLWIILLILGLRCRLLGLVSGNSRVETGVLAGGSRLSGNRIVLCTAGLGEI